MLFLIDGSAILYRSFYGIAPLKTISGQATQAILGFLRSLKKIMKTFNPDHLLIAWDSPISNRKKEFAEYKSNRLIIPDELLSQKIILEEILKTIKIAQITKPGFEADDILHSMSKLALDKNWTDNVTIVTPDKDLLQLVTQNVTVFDPFKDALFDNNLVTKTLGFPPSKVNFYHSLLGDSSDNIPGVTGIGKESAKKLVAQFQSLNDLYENIDQAELRLQKKLISGKNDAFLSQALFTLRDPDCSEVDLNLTNISSINWGLGQPLFEKYELKSMFVEKKQTMNEQFREEEEFCEKLNLEIISSVQKLDLLIAKISTTQIFSFDLETTGLSWIDDAIIGISCYLPNNEAFYIPVSNVDPEKNQPLDGHLENSIVFNKFRCVFENPEILKIVHNGKFDGHFLQNKAHINIFNNTFDTAIAGRLCLPEWIKVGLKNLSQIFLNLKRKSFSDLAKESGTDFRKIPLEKIAKYAALDALQTFELYKIFSQKLADSPSLLKSFWEIEMPLSPILLKMEEQGILFDTECALNQSDAVNKKLEVVTGKIFSFLDTLDLAPDKKSMITNINLNSPLQLQVLFFDILKLPTFKKSGSGKFSTDIDVLEELAQIHPIPQLILEYRKLFKIKSTYLEGLAAHRNAQTLAIHTDYSQLIVSTGRLSSLNPNLQNIPLASDGINVRNCFVARPGHYFISADYSQIELRVLAHISQDKHLNLAFQNEEDIHIKTACTIFGKQSTDITSYERNIAKKINFSVLYGLSAFSLSKDLKISSKKAQEYIDAFFSAYPQVKVWMNEAITRASENGFITTDGGRQRWFNSLNDRNLLVVKAERRAAINAIIQGSAAEIIKIAMIRIHNYLNTKNMLASQSYMLLQVHDEILFECKNPINKAFLEEIGKIMEGVKNWKIPLPVNLKIGVRWGEMSNV